jgi:hypothetical protein
MSAANKHRAKLPENPADIALSGQNGLLINGSAARADPRGSAAEVADTGVGKKISRRRQT